jgi:hypothetical protein
MLKLCRWKKVRKVLLSEGKEERKVYLPKAPNTTASSKSNINAQTKKEIQLTQVTDSKVSLLVGVPRNSQERPTRVSVRSHVSEPGIHLAYSTPFHVLVRTDTITVPKSTRRFTASANRVTFPPPPPNSISPRRQSPPWVDSHTTAQSPTTGS